MKSVSISVVFPAINPELQSRQEQEKDSSKREIKPGFLDPSCRDQVCLSDTGREQKYPMKTTLICYFPDEPFPEKQSSPYPRLPAVEFSGYPLEDPSFSVKIFLCQGYGRILILVQAGWRSAMQRLCPFHCLVSVRCSISRSEGDWVAISRSPSGVVLNLCVSVPEKPWLSLQVPLELPLVIPRSLFLSNNLFSLRCALVALFPLKYKWSVLSSCFHF